MLLQPSGAEMVTTPSRRLETCRSPACLLGLGTEPLVEGTRGGKRWSPGSQLPIPGSQTQQVRPVRGPGGEHPAPRRRPPRRQHHRTPRLVPVEPPGQPDAEEPRQFPNRRLVALPGNRFQDAPVRPIPRGLMRGVELQAAWAVDEPDRPQGRCRFPSPASLRSASGKRARFPAASCDPRSGSWGSCNRLAPPCSEHAARRVQNGNVPVAGGYSVGALATVEVYDAMTGTRAPTGTLGSACHDAPPEAQRPPPP